MIFGEYLDIVENDFLTMQRFQDISRFLYSRGWQVCCWFEFWLDYHVNSVERKLNEQQLSSQASPSGERSEHETCNKMEEFAFDSIHCCLPTSISMLGNLKLEKNFMQNKSLIIPEINLLLNWEKQCNCESFSLWISWPIFLSHAGERLT